MRNRCSPNYHLLENEISLEAGFEYIVTQGQMTGGLLNNTSL